MQSGDIHPNPGADSTSTVHEDSLSSDVLTNHLSIFHLNILSLLPKIGVMRAESDSYDILVLSGLIRTYPILISLF